VVLRADQQPTEVMKPSEKSFCSPTSAVAAQRTTVLRRHRAITAMRRDHLDAIALRQISIQAVTVICFVADQSCREGVEETFSEHPFDKLAFVRRSVFDTNGQRKTVIISESDDFRPLAAFGGADREAPFFVPVKEASIKASSSCSSLEPVTPLPAHARCAQSCLPLPTAGSGGGRSGRADICWAVLATAPLYPRPRGFH
jgi:hypothetical protein